MHPPFMLIFGLTSVARQPFQNKVSVKSQRCLLLCYNTAYFYRIAVRLDNPWCLATLESPCTWKNGQTNWIELNWRNALEIGNDPNDIAKLSRNLYAATYWTLGSSVKRNRHESSIIFFTLFCLVEMKTHSALCILWTTCKHYVSTVTHSFLFCKIIHYHKVWGNPTSAVFIRFEIVEHEQGISRSFHIPADNLVSLV